MEEGWKKIFETVHEYQAIIARDILEEAGLKVVIINQHDSTYTSFGEFLVYVPQDEAAAALQIIKDLKN